MTRVTISLCMTAAMAWTVALAAQNPPTTQPRTTTPATTPTTTPQARDNTTAVSYIGCVEAAGPNAFALTVSELPTAAATPNASATTTRPTGTSGSATVGQRVQLIGSARSNINTHVGHKVEVTGTMVPQGAAQGRTTGQPAAEMRLNVTNVRMISAMCDPAPASTPETRPRSQAPDSTTQPGRTPGAAGTTGTTPPTPDTGRPPAEPAPEQPQRQP